VGGNADANPTLDIGALLVPIADVIKVPSIIAAGEAAKASLTERVAALEGELAAATEAAAAAAAAAAAETEAAVAAATEAATAAAQEQAAAAIEAAKAAADVKVFIGGG
jgi:hypothetical protein